MNHDELIRRLMRTFVGELDEHVRALSRDLVGLEQATSSIVRAELIRSLLRTMHSLKGASQSVRVTDLEIACHRFEEILLHLQPDGPGDRPRPDLVGLLLVATDAMHEAGHRLEKGETLRGSRLEALMARLEDAAASPAPAAPADAQPVTITTVEDRIESVRTADALLDELRPSTPLREPDATCSVPATARFEDVCEGIERSVEDLATQASKQVRVELMGRDREFDLDLMERLRDPLRHLVRNAVDHGIEAPELRRAHGKDPEGRIELAAQLDGRHMLVSVSDDGCGIDRAAVREAARKRGIAIDGKAEETRLIFLPGLTTRSVVTGLSGRGMGLDVVRARVEALGGTIEVESKALAGTRFTLRLPLAVPATRVLLVEAAGQPFAFPDGDVQRVIEIDPEKIRKVLGRPVLVGEGPPLALVTLAASLGLDETTTDTTRRPALVVKPEGEEPMVVAVDRVDGVHDLVVRGLGHRIRVPALSGAAVLTPERIALVVRSSELLATVRSRGRDAETGIRTNPRKEKP